MNRMNEVNFPFENLMRNFSPMTSWKKFFNPQFYFTYNTGDEDIENHVLEEVGSYGKQLGRIIDVLDVFVDGVPIGTLTPEQLEAIVEFRKLSRKVKASVVAFKKL